MDYDILRCPNLDQNMFFHTFILLKSNYSTHKLTHDFKSKRSICTICKN